MRAMKDYDEILAVVKKLDGSRFIMNKLMGPEGALGKQQRDKYLHGHQEEHDQLLSNIGNKPFGQGVQSSASKAYFGSAGIAGGPS